MNNIQADQPQNLRPLSELFARCEIRAIASRIATAVARFFEIVARFISESYSNVRDRMLSCFRDTSNPTGRPPVNTISGLEGSSAEKEPKPSALVRAEVPQSVREVPVATQSDVPQSVREVPVATQKDVLEYFGKNLQSLGVSEYNIGDSVKELKKYEKAEQEDIAEHVLQLITVRMNSQDIIGIIDEIAKFPKDERELIKQMVPERIDPWEMGMIFRAMFELNPPRTNTIELALKLISLRTGASERIEVMQCVESLPIDARQGVVELALASVIIPGMNGSERKKVLKTIGELPQDQRGAIVQCAKIHLFNPRMDADARCRQIAKVEALGYKRELFEKVIKTKKGRDPHFPILDECDKALLLKGVSKASCLSVSSSLKLITETMGGYFRLHIIEKLNEMSSEEEMKAAVDFVIELIPESTSNDQRSEVLDIYLKLENEETRVLFIQCFKNAKFSSELPINPKRKIMELLSYQPKDQWGGILGYLKSNIDKRLNIRSLNETDIERLFNDYFGINEE